MNDYFPDWEEANLVLDPFIDENFGVYMSKPTEDAAYITFLPEDKLAEIVPPEQASKLNELARAFTTVMNELLNRKKVLTDVSDSLTDKEQEDIIRDRFQKFIDEYKAEKGDDLRDVLKHFFGCPVMLKEHY